MSDGHCLSHRDGKFRGRPQRAYSKPSRIAAPRCRKKKEPLKSVEKAESFPLASVFFPPELASQSGFEGFQGKDTGQPLELLRRAYTQRLFDQKSDDSADRALVDLVLQQARKVIAHPSRPTVRLLESFDRQPFGEIALEESLDESARIDDPAQLLVEQELEKRFSCVAILDCSSSMTGEKHLLASISVAVLLLELPPREASVITFSSDAKSIKSLREDSRPGETVLKFLKTRPKGFTNISKGLSEALTQYKKLQTKRRRIALIATDGRSTEGEDPLQLAKQFDFLVVLHLNGPGSHIDGSRALAAQGHGICLEVGEHYELPSRLYEALRFLTRL